MGEVRDLGWGEDAQGPRTRSGNLCAECWWVQAVYGHLPGATMGTRDTCPTSIFHRSKVGRGWMKGRITWGQAHTCTHTHTYTHLITLQHPFSLLPKPCAPPSASTCSSTVGRWWLQLSPPPHCSIALPGPVHTGHSSLQPLLTHFACSALLLLPAVH